MEIQLQQQHQQQQHYSNKNINSNNKNAAKKRGKELDIVKKTWNTLSMLSTVIVRKATKPLGKKASKKQTVATPTFHQGKATAK